MNIVLACAAGASTSMLEDKMLKEAAKRGIDLKIRAYSYLSLTDKIVDPADVILLGPQLRFCEAEVRKKFPGKSSVTAVIESRDYGMMEAAKILNMAIWLMENNKE